MRKKTLFGGLMVNNVEGAVAKTPAYQAWVKDVGESCFYRGGQEKSIFRPDGQWTRFSGFLEWWGAQDHESGGVVSSLLAPGAGWAVMGPYTCDIVPRALFKLLKHYYLAPDPIGDGFFRVRSGLTKVIEIDGGEKDRAAWVARELLRYLDGGRLDKKIEAKALELTTAPLWRCRWVRLSGPRRWSQGPQRA